MVKAKSFKERYAEEVELADQKVLQSRKVDENLIHELKLKYLKEKNITITEKMREVKTRPNIEEPKHGRLFFYIEEKKSMRYIATFDLVLVLTGVMLPRSIYSMMYSSRGSIILGTYISVRRATSIILILTCVVVLGYIGYLMTCTDAGSASRN